MTSRTPRAFLALGIAALALAACDRPPTPRTADTRAAQERVDAALERAQEKIARAADRTREQLEQAGEKTQAALASGEASDAGITASIKASILKDPDLSVLKIDVDTRDGVVTLNGLAGDEAARERAGRMAGATKGVREVRNFLVTKRA